MADLRAKVHRFYLYQASTSFAIWIPFWTLWIRRHLASDFEFTLVDVTFWVGLLAFQLPAGIMADKYGRKRMILLSEVFRTVGILGYGLGTTFVEYQLANLVWSLGAAFSVGTSAYLYDTLLEAGHEPEFPRYIGRNTTIQLASNAAGALAGGVVVSLTGSLELTLLLGAALNLVAIAVALSFVEPKVSRATEPTFAKQLVMGWRVVRRREGVALLIAFHVTLGVTLYCMALFRPLYLTESLRLPEAQIALWVSGFLLVAALVTSVAGSITRRLGEFGTLALVVGLASAAFLGLWYTGPVPLAVLLQAPLYVAWTLQPIATTSFLNRRLEPGQRATVLSMSAFAFTLGLVAALPLVGLVTSTTENLLDLGLLLGVAAVVPGIYILARWRATVAPWPEVTPVPTRLLPETARVSRFNRIAERMSRLKP